MIRTALKFIARGCVRRSGKWAAVRRRHLTRQPACQWCGGTQDVEVHHIMPFHLHRELELEPRNLVTLCEHGDLDCHLRHGHLGNWRSFNPFILHDIRTHHAQ